MLQVFNIHCTCVCPLSIEFTCFRYQFGYIDSSFRHEKVILSAGAFTTKSTLFARYRSYNNDGMQIQLDTAFGYKGLSENSSVKSE